MTRIPKRTIATITEYAKARNLKPRLVRYWVSAKGAPAFQITPGRGSTKYVDVEEMDTWLEGHRISGRPLTGRRTHTMDASIASMCQLSAGHGGDNEQA